MGQEYWVTWPNFDMKKFLEQSFGYQFAYKINFWFYIIGRNCLIVGVLTRDHKNMISPYFFLQSTTQTSSQRIVRETLGHVTQYSFPIVKSWSAFTNVIYN